MPRSVINKSEVLEVNRGLYLGQPEHLLPTGALTDCLNVRIKNKRLGSYNMGWAPYTVQGLNGPVTLFDVFFRVDGSEELIAGTLTDLFTYDAGGPRWRFITPRYETGTASASGTAVTGVGTVWLTGPVPVRTGDEISFGATGRRDQSDLWYRISAVGTDTSLTLDLNVGTISAGAYTIRQKFQSANLNNYWRSRTFPRSDVSSVIADRWYATNGGVDAIVRYAQSDTQVTRIHLGASGFRCRDLVRFKNMMLYFNIIENTGAAPNKPQSFKNSDAGKPEVMTGGISGEFVAASGTSRVSTAAPIGDNLAIYTENEVFLTTFVGSPDIWAFREVVSGTGISAGRLLAPYPDTHLFMGRDALYSFNGIQSVSQDNHIWFQALRQQDQNRINASFSIFDEENGQLLWAVAKTSDMGPVVPLNLLLYSENLNTTGTAIWNLFNATVTADNAADPLTGLVTAEKLIEDATAGVSHGISQKITKAASSLTYTFSIYCDPDTRTKVRLRLENDASTDSVSANFDLIAGTVTSFFTVGSGWTAVDAIITPVGTYYRVSLTATSDTDTAIRAVIRLLDASGNLTYDGDGTSGMWVTGAQLVQSPNVPTYIRTTIAAVIAPTERGPDFAHEQAYLEEVPPEAPQPYTQRQFPFTVAGFSTRTSEILWSSLVQTWASYNFAWGDRILSAAFPLILVGDIVGRVYQINTTDAQDGVGYASFATFGRRLISDIRSRNLLRRLYLLVKRLAGGAVYGLGTTVSLYEHPDSTATADVQTTFALDLGGDPWLPVYRVGRLAQLQVGTAGSATGQPWEIWGYDWDVTRGGER
jgi:hypothetical protein